MDAILGSYFDTIAAGLFLLFFALLIYKWISRKTWHLELHFRAPHLIQMFVQSSILIFMSLYTIHVQKFAPLILAQFFFAFAIDAAISIARYGRYRIGVAFAPIVLSTNLFIWFLPDYFALQLAMITLGVVSKHYWQWNVNGVRQHIFNPSAVGMFAGAWFMILFGLRYSQILAVEESYSGGRPWIFLWILFAGSLSQYVGGITPISFGAAITLFSLSQLTELATGAPLMNQWIDPAVMVGVTLLVTDPATSPKKTFSRFLFGCAYGVGIMISYGLLSYFRETGYFAKIMPVPFLNLAAHHFDRIPQPRLSESWKILEKPWAQAVAYILIMLMILPSANKPKQVSWLGSLGGIRWAIVHDR